MGKTYKDLPKDVSHYKPFRKRKKPLSDKLKEPPEAPVLDEQYWDVEGEAFIGGWD